jgi:hypothetical protein
MSLYPLVRRAGAVLTTLLLTSLLVGGLIAPVSAAVARPPAARSHVSRALLDPTLTASPAVASPGERITVSGGGFVANETVTLAFDGNLTYSSRVQATAAGQVPASAFTVPAVSGPGAHKIVATGAASRRVATAAVAVTTVSATLTATPASTTRGGTTVLGGTGWGANEAITVTLDSVATPLAVVHATPQGAFPGTPVTIPYTATVGAHTLTATGAVSKRTATAALTINAVAATLVATPPSTTRGGTTVLSGAGWAADETITVTLSDLASPLAVVHATPQGAFPGTPVTIPYTATVGAHTLTAIGAVSKRTATATLTLSAVSATFAVAPAATNRGGLITLSGGNFAPGEAVTVTIEGVITPLAAITATAGGTLSATGVSIPYSVPVGPHTLRATGAVSQRAATAAITVAALTPSISLNPATAAPGATVTVTGRGFGREERVTLALNGEAIATTVPITTADGAFSAAFVVPNTAINGSNTVSAVGNESRVTAVTALTGMLPGSPRFYFAGGLNTATEHSVVQVLNTNGQPASLRLIFYFENGASYTELATVGAHAQAVIPVAQYRLQAGTFGLQLNADRQVSAQMTITRDGRDGDTLLGNTAPGTTWYLAEGYTGLTFHETVSILNPDPAVAAHAQLQLLPFGGRAGRTVSVTVAPHSNLVTDINALLPGQSLSVIAASDRPVVVERTLTFSTPGPTGAPGNGVTGYGMTTRAGSNTPATSWLLAEGTTVTRFQTFLTILNPNVTPALVTASFFSRGGASLGSRTIVVDGRSRANIKLNDLFYASGVASVVTSNQPIVVERPEYFGSPNGYRVAGSDVFGRNGAGVRWSFPAGNTQGRSEFLLVFNPSATTVPIDVVAYGGNGQTLTRRVLVPPTVRYNIDVGQLFAGFDPQHGIVLQSASGVGFVAEQTVFAPDYSALRSTQGLAQ